MQLLYFGWVKAQIGHGGETVELPGEVSDVRGLVDWLRARGGRYADALDDVSAVRVAVNQELAELDAPVGQGDEVALFPPMTGG